MTTFTSTLRVGIAGLGTVGCGTIDILHHNKKILAERTGCNIVITAVSARDRSKERNINLDGIAWEDDAINLTKRDDVDLIVELIGGSEGIAKELVERALQEGKHVVTANKALIAHHGASLARLAEKKPNHLLFEAAVAGGIPIIKLIKDGLAANQYQKVIGILNGTCNYILTVMEETGRQFGEALTEAQELGYAEADPTFDIDGIDAAHKLTILSALAFGYTPAIEYIFCQGIRDITASDIQSANDLGYKIRLIGVTQRRADGIELRVHPALMKKENSIAKVNGVYNAVHVFGDAIGDVFVEGPGAGREATASAVVADIIDIARNNHVPAFMVNTSSLDTTSITSMEQYKGAYYLRLQVEDNSGVLAAITQIFSQHEVSVARLIQHETTTENVADIVLTTHETIEKNMNNALKEIAMLDAVLTTPKLIRIEL